MHSNSDINIFSVLVLVNPQNVFALVCMFVGLLICQQDESKSYAWILMKFSAVQSHFCIRNGPFDTGDDMDLHSVLECSCSLHLGIC